jgi:hypothetical protein
MDLILYHNNCPDGWCAAYIAKKKYPKAELVPLNHGLDNAAIDALMEKCRDKGVLMMDYSLPTVELNDRLYAVAMFFRILDHHKSAKEVLGGRAYATFDMNRSGAGLAWDYLFGKDSGLAKTAEPSDGGMVPYHPTYFHEQSHFAVERPWWVNYTEDQDLWNWKLASSHEINAYLMVQPRTEVMWDAIAQMSASEAIELGTGVRQYIDYYTRSVVAEAQPGILDGWPTGVLNIPYAGVSEAGNALVNMGYDIGLAWFENGRGEINFSLRSNKKGSDIDVSAIAKDFGGGGHRNAAGFKLGVKEGRGLVDAILGRGTYVPTSRCC